MADTTCNTCAKKVSTENPLRPCAKFKSEWYCDRKCQSADWKSHKKVCSKHAYDRNVNENVSASTTPNNVHHSQQCFVQLLS
ncbi:hypothetical protein BDV12DRAFT_163600 [Aspergillus spectabilis]